jgi:hypothetical protein
MTNARPETPLMTSAIPLHVCAACGRRTFDVLLTEGGAAVCRQCLKAQEGSR